MASMFLLITVFVLDLIAFAFAVAAEQRRSTTRISTTIIVYDSDISTGLGVGAFLFLLASQDLIMVASRCFCCGKPLNPGGSRTLELVLFIICW
ncbi:hypothetical protein D0Y65_015674 [Glycine soja]|uniref:Uncharacterized protein n=2 Tax=Glycine subgen. Soja TaxID=1462606 RepID=K7KX72_SOYBN|nr:hypothetical protein JHK87_016347 [Glycine soja]KAG5047051.1 hypothetical protein JHK86_016457 [Glycine max]RZC09047.1 hypothetical protein D0Y65_015674 [Glycine soja]